MIPFFDAHDVYNVIARACDHGWFKDNEYGFPLFREEDVHPVEGQEAFFVNSRFEKGKGYGAESVVRRVCAELGIEPRFEIVQMEEWGIPFIELHWVLV